jgi:hypothetical protein
MSLFHKSCEREAEFLKSIIEERDKLIRDLLGPRFVKKPEAVATKAKEPQGHFLLPKLDDPRWPGMD